LLNATVQAISQSRDGETTKLSNSTSMVFPRPSRVTTGSNTLLKSHPMVAQPT
jgi:hypothetical protein